MLGKYERRIIGKSDLGKFFTLVDVDSFGYGEWLDRYYAIAWLQF
jgi:hypothetical protein